MQGRGGGGGGGGRIETNVIEDECPAFFTLLMFVFFCAAGFVPQQRIQPSVCLESSRN